MPGSPRGNPIEVLGHAVMLVSAFAKKTGVYGPVSPAMRVIRNLLKELPSQADVVVSVALD